MHDRADFNSFLVHRHQEIAQPPVALSAFLGAGNHEAPVGELRQRSPDFLPVDDPSVAFQSGFGGYICQVGTSIGFGIALAPEFFAREDGRNEAMLLFFGAEGQQGGAQQRDSHVGHSPRSFGFHIGGVENDLLHKRVGATTEFYGIVQPEPAACGQLAFPLNQKLRLKVFLPRPALAPHLGEFAHQMLFQPSANFFCEVLLRFCQ